MKSMKKLVVAAFAAVFGLCGLTTLANGLLVSEDTTVFAFGNYVKLNVPGVEHARYEISTNGVPMTSGGKTDGQFYVPADAVPVKVTYTPAPGFQFQNPSQTEWEYGSDDTKEEEITLNKQEVLDGIGEITSGAPVEYFVWDEAKKQLVAQTCTAYTVLTAETTTLEDGIWYVVNDDVVIDRGETELPGLNVNGSAHLILCDGESLAVTGGMLGDGIRVRVDGTTTNSVSIYGQEGQSGMLTANGGKYAAGIGCVDSSECGIVTIHGGVVTANGNSLMGTGIGGGQAGGVVTINGGMVTANGGKCGAGIGTYFVHVDGGIVMINGGFVIANGGENAAGIGGGSLGEGTGGRGGTVTIAGGTVIATGNANGAGIGGGDDGRGGSVTIIAGDVTAIGGETAEGIGTGRMHQRPGTFALGPFTAAAILAGMDPTGEGAIPVVAENFADQDAMRLGWHRQRYVHVTAVKLPAPGSPEKPWDIGTNGSGQPQAVTNGNNEVIVTGEGLPKPYGENDPAPWAGFDPKIETIYVPQDTEGIYKKQWPDDADKINGLPDYLSFTAKDGDVKISFGKTYAETYGLEYSFDPTAKNDVWTALPEFDLNGTAGDADKVLVPNGQTLYIRKTDNAVTLGIGSNGKKGTFKMERVDETGMATVEAGGNVMSLLDRTCRSKEVGAHAFDHLFKDCGLLTTAPKLPATKLAAGCYWCMFCGCSALKTAPELPAEKLEESCYIGMFLYCGQLEKAPELPAKELADGCYQEMFKDCVNLNYVKVAFDVWPSEESESCKRWLDNVASEGTFVCSAALENDFGTQKLSYGMNTIPNGWRTVRDYLSFTAKDGDIKLELQVWSNPLKVEFEYSFNAGAEVWAAYGYKTSIEIKKDQTVYFRKKGEAVEAISCLDGSYRFVFEGTDGATVAAGGNVMSMLDPTCESRTIGEYGLYSLFDNCTRLVSAPRIEADTIKTKGCCSMFEKCTSLTAAPVIVADDIFNEFALENMFAGAQALNEITVCFTNWHSVTTYNWVKEVAPFGVFRCPSELPIEVDPSRIPEGWIVYKTFSIPAIEGLEHYVGVSMGHGDNAGEVAPCAVSPDGTKTYEVVAGGNATYMVYFESYDGYAAPGNNPIDLGNLSEGIAIGSEKYPLPELGVLLTVEEAPEDSTFTIYCGENVFDKKMLDRNLTARVSTNLVTKVVYTADKGYAFAFKDGEPVTEIVQLEKKLTADTVVSAPTKPDNYGEVWTYADKIQKGAEQFVSGLSGYPPVVQTEGKNKLEEVKAIVAEIKADPLPSTEKKATLNTVEDDLTAWSAQFIKDADGFVQALNTAEQMTKTWADELTALEPTEYYKAKGEALIKDAQAKIEEIRANGTPTVKDRKGDLATAAAEYTKAFTSLKQEVEEFKQAKTAATEKLEQIQKKLTELMSETDVAAQWEKMNASPDPQVQKVLAEIKSSREVLEKDLGNIKSALDAAQNKEAVDETAKNIDTSAEELDNIRKSILEYQIPTYTLQVNVVNPDKVTYSVYTGETAQVTIVADQTSTADFHYVYETPVKVVYKLITPDWAFDDAENKNVDEFVALNETMQKERKISEPALGELKKLDAAYNNVTNQFAIWEKDAEPMPDAVKEEIKAYIADSRKSVDGLYSVGVPVNTRCEEITGGKDKTWDKIGPLFEQGYQQLSYARGEELRKKHENFINDNADRITEINQYGTTESKELMARVEMLQKDCDTLDEQIKSGFINNKSAYEELLLKKQKLEEQMTQLAKDLEEAIRYVSALPISAERDLEGNIVVRSYQTRTGIEQRWLYLWYSEHVEDGALAMAASFVGQKYYQISEEELYQYYSATDCFREYSAASSIGDLRPPSSMEAAACVIAAIDAKGTITRVGGVGGLGELAPGEVKGADIAGDTAMSISYFVSKNGMLYPAMDMALPLASGDAPVVLDAGASGHYVVLGDCEIPSLTVRGKVTLVLGRGCDFSVPGGIVIEEDSILRICSEHDFSKDAHLTGRMTVEKTGVDTEYPAAIFGRLQSELEIHGGVIDIVSATAGIRVDEFFRMLNGDVAVTGGAGYAGIEPGEKSGFEIQAGTLNVTGGAGAAAIGGNIGQIGGIVNVFGGIVRADATPTEDGKCGAGIGAGADGCSHGPFMCFSGQTVFAAPNATSKMKIAADYGNTREPSVLITTGVELVQPLPFTLTKDGNYRLQMPGNPHYSYITFALTKDDLARAYGEGSTVGAEIWQMVSHIATGARVAVGEMTYESFRRSLCQMGIDFKNLNENRFNGDSYYVGQPGSTAMIVAIDCDNQNRIVRLGGINVPESMPENTVIDSPIGRESIGLLTFQVKKVSQTDIGLLQDGLTLPGEGETLCFCFYDMNKIAAVWGTEEKLSAAVARQIGCAVGTVGKNMFMSTANETMTSTFKVPQSLYEAVVALIYDEHGLVKRIGVLTGIGTISSGTKESDAALVGAQSFAVSADSSDWATIRMPGSAQPGQAWLWVRVSSETKYEALDAFVNGLIGQRVGSEGTILQPLDASAMPATFGKGNWGLFTGDSVQINRFESATGNPMRGVVVFKVATLPTTATGSEMTILTAGGVKNFDKLADGQELSNQYGEEVERIGNQPFTVTRQGDDEQSLLVAPEGELPENGSWRYMTFGLNEKPEEIKARLLAYKGAAVGDLTVDRLQSMGLWTDMTTEASFTVPGDRDGVFLFKVDGEGKVLAIGLAEELAELYEPGMSKGDSFGKTFIAAQNFGVTRAGDALTATVYMRDAYEAESAHDRFVCFTYADADALAAAIDQLMVITNGTEVGACKLSTLVAAEPTTIGTFSTDELSLGLPADCPAVFVARVHGADDTIVTLGGVLTGDIGEGEMRRPDEGSGVIQIRPFEFTVTRDEDGTFTLNTTSGRRQNEEWLWLAVPPHVRYVMEQEFESSESLLAQLRREMIVLGSVYDATGYKSTMLTSDTLTMMLGEGYYGRSLDAKLDVKQIPADTELVLVFKLDRGTGCTLGEGGVIGLDQLAVGETKQNQIDGKISYVEVDEDGNRTEKEATVEAITELTTSIGGGRWYVMTDLQTYYDGKEVVNRITVDGEANIILYDVLANDKQLKGALNGGIAVNEGATLNIYGQQMGNGALRVVGADGCAAIGGDEGCGCGTINIYGGLVSAEAGAGAAAIGGGYLNGTANGQVNLYGGIVMARAFEAAAIGGGRFGCGCDVRLYPAATLFCVSEDGPTTGVGGCDGMDDGEVHAYGENRVYLEADEAFTPHPRDYYFGSVRRGDFVSTELLTVSLPKDKRLECAVKSLTLGGDLDAVLPGEDDYTYKVLRGDSIVVLAGVDGASEKSVVKYGFRSPNVFKFGSVQSDVTLTADDLKIAPSHAVTTLDFEVARDELGKLSLRAKEAFAPGEQLLWMVIRDGAEPPQKEIVQSQLAMMFYDPVGLLDMLLNENLSVGDFSCDQFALILGAKNWNIAFDYAGEAIPLPEDARSVLAFKVYDAGKYASMLEKGLKNAAPSGKKDKEKDKDKDKEKEKGSAGRLALIKVGAIRDVTVINPEKPLQNEVNGNVLIARQPFALMRNADETFTLTLSGTLDEGEKWGFAAISSEGLAVIESGEIDNLTVDAVKTVLDGVLGRVIGSVTTDDFDEFSMLFSQFGTSESSVFTCPADTAAVIAFKARGADKGDFICTLGYTFDDLQAMTPSGTERKGNEIDGETDAPIYFVTVENIPAGVKASLSYAFGDDGEPFYLSTTVSPEGTAQFAVPEGADVRVYFEAPDHMIFRTKDTVSITAIHQDELVDASFLILTERNLIGPQYFDLRRNGDKTFALEMPDGALEVEKGDRWFYFALNAQDAALLVEEEMPAGTMLWTMAAQMIGQEVGSNERLTTLFFTTALREGYSGYTAERSIQLPADAEMVIVCKSFNVTEEDGFSVTYVETVGGSQNLQRMGVDDQRGNEVDALPGNTDAFVHYQKWDKATRAFVPGGEQYVKLLTDATTAIGDDQWYAVPPMESVSAGTITVQGTANIIVADLATFEVDKFVVGEGATLNVYGQSQRLGMLVVGGEGVAFGSDAGCGTINLHGVIAMVEGGEVGVGGKVEGGELNVLGANLLVMAQGPAIAGCTVNAYGGRVLAASLSGTYPAINDGLALKSGKMGIFAGSTDPSVLTPTKVADYLASRQPFAKIVEQVNVILPKVEHVNATVSTVDVVTNEDVPVEGEELPGTGWVVYKVERFDNVSVKFTAESGYQLRSPAEYMFYSIDADKQLPADAVVVVPQTPPQLIARQPFSIYRATDDNGQPYCELKPIGELGPGEKWYWLSCDKMLAQTTGTVGDKDTTTEEEIRAMVNMAIGNAPVGYVTVDEFRFMLPVYQSGVGTDAAFRLPADTDLVLVSKVYDVGPQEGGMVRYYNVTLGLSTNLTERLEQGDSSHNEVGGEPTDEEIKNALEEAFPEPHVVEQNEDGSFRITLMEDMTGPVEIPDNLGEIVLDMNGFNITGTNGVNGADGGNAIVIVDSGDVGPTTELMIVEPNEKYDAEGDIVGGNGADGKVPGNGGAAIRVDTKRGVTVNVEGTVQVVGGRGGMLLDGESGNNPGDPGPGIDPEETHGDRAQDSVKEGETGGKFPPWAKAKLRDGCSADEIAPLLPEGVTAVGGELWFWKRSGENGEKIGFDFRAIELEWLDENEIRFAAGTFQVDEFTYAVNDRFVFVGADSAAVAGMEAQISPVVVPAVDPEKPVPDPYKPVVNPDQPAVPVTPSEKPVVPVVNAVMGGLTNPNPNLPDLGKYTVLVSTGKSIFRATDGVVTAFGPLMKDYATPATWRNLGFTALPGTVVEGNGGALCVADTMYLLVADCAFAGLAAGQMGGAIYAAGLATGGMITNSTFTACSVSKANGMGGAIYATGGTAPLLAAGPLGDRKFTDPELAVVDCEFTLNSAESGGAICTSPMYGLEMLIDLVIDGTSFGGNAAGYNGGAICACGKVTVADAEAGCGTFFGDNEAGVYGGALAIDGVAPATAGSTVSVGSNTVFACNKVANDWAGEALGGAINLPADCSLFVRNAMFTNNVASCTGGSVYGVYGGAICTDSGCSNVIEKTYFLDNRAIANGSAGDRYACGGALSDVEGALTLVDTCVFDRNVAEGQVAIGAALDLEGDVESAVVNSTFRRSNVEAVSVFQTPVAVRNCVIVDNGADADLYIENTTGYELTFTAYGAMLAPGSTFAASSNNIESCVAAAVYRGETVYLATNEYNKVAALGYPQPGVTDIEGVEYGSKFWGTSMGAFETAAIYPVEELGFEITVDPLELAWTGMKVHPTSVAVTNPFTRVELTEGVDYEVTFENDVNSTDKALVVVTGIGNYSGTATTNYWITSYLVKYYACEKGEGDVEDNDRLLEEVELGSLSGSNVVAKIAPPAGYVLDPFHEGTKTNGTVTLYDSMVMDEVNGRLLLKVFYAKSAGGDDDIPDKYQRKITYKVVNGWWDGDEKNGLDKTVWVTLLDGDGNWSEDGTGTLTGIPAVGQTPFSGYAKAGVWYPAPPNVNETVISRTDPAIPFMLYVYCPQSQGGGGRGGRMGQPTTGDLEALRNHLEMRFSIKMFAVAGGLAQMGAKAAVVDNSTGKSLADVDAARMTLKVLGTTDLSSGEWTTFMESTTDGNGVLSLDLPEGVNQLFLKLESAEK